MTFKLEWIKELIDTIPETNIGRKNIIEIAGYPRWENVNSNLLAFYFDENEEHNFGRLFINSLFNIIEFKLDDSSFSREDFETEFKVDREVPTLNGGRIDILISNKDMEEEVEDEAEYTNGDWSIIIENKIKAPLNNDLTDYWDSTRSEKTLGIVLSIEETKIETNHEHTFINITHKELVDKVKESLPEYYLDSDDRHLLFLKEYFSSVYSFYKNDNFTKIMDSALRSFHTKETEIKEFKKVDLNLLRYLSNTVFNVMTESGFPPVSTKNTSKSKHFQIGDEADRDSLSNFLWEHLEYAKKFRFWIPISDLRYSNQFECYFELHGKHNTVYGDKLKAELEAVDIFNNHIRKDSDSKSGGNHYHIYSISIPLDLSDDESFSVTLKRELDSKLFKNEAKFIETAIIKLKEVIEEH